MCVNPNRPPLLLLLVVDSFAHVLSCVSEINAHTTPIKSIAFMSDGTGLMTGSVDKTIKMWNLRATPPEPQTNPVDGEVQHLNITGNYLMWANSIQPAYSPSDAVGVVELMDMTNNTRAKCLVSLSPCFMLLL